MRTRDGDSWRTRLAVIVKRNPIVVATALTLLVATAALGLVIDEQSNGRQRDRDLATTRTTTAARLAKQTRQTAAKLERARQRADGKLRKATKMNCERIHLLERTLEDIVVSSRQSLRAYRDDGTITNEQLRRGLADNERARRKLIGADCPPRKALPG